MPGSLNAEKLKTELVVGVDKAERDLNRILRLMDQIDSRFEKLRGKQMNVPARITGQGNTDLAQIVARASRAVGTLRTAKTPALKQAALNEIVGAQNTLTGMIDTAAAAYKGARGATRVGLGGSMRGAVVAKKALGEVMEKAGVRDYSHRYRFNPNKWYDERRGGTVRTARVSGGGQFGMSKDEAARSMGLVSMADHRKRQAADRQRAAEEKEAARASAIAAREQARVATQLRQQSLGQGVMQTRGLTGRMFAMSQVGQRGFGAGSLMANMMGVRTPKASGEGQQMLGGMMERMGPGQRQMLAAMAVGIRGLSIAWRGMARVGALAWRTVSVASRFAIRGARAAIRGMANYTRRAFSMVGRSIGRMFRGMSFYLRHPMLMMTRIRHMAWNLMFLFGMIGGAAYAAVRTLRPAGRMETWEKQFGVLLGKGQGRNEQESLTIGETNARTRIDWLTRVSTYLKFTMGQTVEAGRAMETFGIWSKRNFMIAADAASAYGKSLDQVVNALGYLSQGRFGAAMRMLMRLRISRAALETQGIRFSRGGRLKSSPEEALAAVLKLWDSKVGGMAARMADTFEVALVNVGDAWFRFLGRGMRGLLPYGTQVALNVRSGLEAGGGALTGMNWAPIGTSIAGFVNWSIEQALKGNYTERFGDSMVRFSGIDAGGERAGKARGSVLSAMGLGLGTAASDIGKALLQSLMLFVVESPQIFAGMWYGLEDVMKKGADWLGDALATGFLKFDASVQRMVDNIRLATGIGKGGVENKIASEYVPGAGLLANFRNEARDKALKVGQDKSNLFDYSGGWLTVAMGAAVPKGIGVSPDLFDMAPAAARKMLTDKMQALQAAEDAIIANPGGVHFGMPVLDKHDRARLDRLSTERKAYRNLRENMPNMRHAYNAELERLKREQALQDYAEGEKGLMGRMYPGADLTPFTIGKPPRPDFGPFQRGMGGIWGSVGQRYSDYAGPIARDIGNRGDLSRLATTKRFFPGGYKGIANRVGMYMRSGGKFAEGPDALDKSIEEYDAFIKKRAAGIRGYFKGDMKNADWRAIHALAGSAGDTIPDEKLVEATMAWRRQRRRTGWANIDPQTQRKMMFRDALMDVTKTDRRPLGLAVQDYLKGKMTAANAADAAKASGDTARHTADISGKLTTVTERIDDMITRVFGATQEINAATGGE